jgi:glycosyltransferase involved in cell wall biosynthesis
MLFYAIVLFAIIIFIQIFYYLFIFGNFAFSKSLPKTSNKKLPVSVIVCAKNEAENLLKYIPLLIEQDYPNFEIVLINDSSYDNTWEVMEAFAEKHNNIKLVEAKEVDVNNIQWSSKKYALTLGIKAAKYEHLLLIDADCYPVSKNWINEMVGSFSTEKTVLLGYGAHETVEKSWLNKLIRFETLMTAMQYFSWAKRGNPYMGVGRNLAYKKEHFFNANGFVEHMKIMSGDDDLFINRIATGQNTQVVISPESFTYTAPKKNYVDWFEQKRRHVSTAKYYKGFDKMILSSFYLSQLLFVISAFTLPIFLALKGYDIICFIVIGFIVLRYIVTYLVVGFTAKKLKESGLVWFYPFIEINLIFAQLMIFFSNLFSKPNRWR